MKKLIESLDNLVSKIDSLGLRFYIAAPGANSHSTLWRAAVVKKESQWHDRDECLGKTPALALSKALIKCLREMDERP